MNEKTVDNLINLFRGDFVLCEGYKENHGPVR